MVKSFYNFTDAMNNFLLLIEIYTSYVTELMKSPMSVICQSKLIVYKFRPHVLSGSTLRFKKGAYSAFTYTEKQAMQSGKTLVKLLETLVSTFLETILDFQKILLPARLKSGY